MSFASLGFIGIVLAFLVEIIPSELALSFAGYLVFNGDITFLEAVAAGVIGGILQQLILYFAGLYLGRPFFNRFGKYVHLKPRHLDLAENWFTRYGTPIVFFARFIPVVRQAISIPAGMTRMNLWKFIIYTGVAAIPWSITFIIIGKSLGENWQMVTQQKHTIWFIVTAFIGVGIALLIIKIRKTRQISPFK